MTTAASSVVFLPACVLGQAAAAAAAAHPCHEIRGGSGAAAPSVATASEYFLGLGE